MKKETTILIDILKQRGNFFHNLNNYIEINNGEGYANILNRVINGNFPVSKANFFPIKYDDVVNYKPVGKSKDLNRILLWSSNIIYYYREEIGKFVEQKNKFDYLVLKGDYTAAEYVLEDIEKEICFSIWSLKSRLLLANLKELAINEYIANMNIDNSVKAFAYLYANSMDKSRNLKQYVRNIEHISKNLKQDFLNCFLYLFTFKNDFKECEYVNIIDYCSSYSIIDGYMALKYVLHNMIEKGVSNSYIVESLRLLSYIENDEEIKFLNSQSNDFEHNPSDSCKKIFDFFTGNQFEQIVDNLDCLTNNINDCTFQKLNIIAKALTLCEDETKIQKDNLFKKIIDSIHKISICISVPEYRQEIERLQFYATLLKWFDLSIPLIHFIEKSFYGKKVSKNILEDCYSIDDGFIYNKIIDGKIQPIFYESIIYYDENNFDVKDIENDFHDKFNNRIYSISLLYLTFYLALKNKDNEYALEIFSRTVACYEASIFRYSLEELYNYVLEDITIREKSTIGDVIFSYLVSELGEYTKVVFKNFLEENEVEKPLDVAQLDLDKNIVNYFLRKICTVENLSCLYMVFNNSLEVEKHRIEICKYLLENDIDKRSIYIKEISDILKEREVKTLKSELDTSKLSVDFSFIYEKIFNDFLELTKKYYSTSPDAMEFVSFDSIAVFAVDPNSWNFYGFSREVIIEKMLKIYVSEFCFGVKGLDTYLSTRVRHGTFQNTLTKVFVENSLFSTDNNFFKSMFSRGAISNGAINIIGKFRKTINNLILELTNKRFKVFVENNIPGALFDYSVNRHDFNSIFAELVKQNTILSVKDFITIMSDCITKKTDNYLNQIRTNILEKLKTDILTSLEQLNCDLKNCCSNDKDSSAISDKISKCKTDIQIKIDEIKNWFYLSESVPMENYSIDKLFNVLKKTLHQQFGDFNNVDIKIENEIREDFKGETFIYLYDIFQILFTNAIVHSGFSDLKSLQVNLSIKKTTDEGISFCVSNNFSNQNDFEKMNNSIDKINNIYSTNAYKTVDTHREGGMGQIKVLDILFNVMGVGREFVADVDSNYYNLKIVTTQTGVINLE